MSMSKCAIVKMCKYKKKLSNLVAICRHNRLCDLALLLLFENLPQTADQAGFHLVRTPRYNLVVFFINIGRRINPID